MIRKLVNAAIVSGAMIAMPAFAQDPNAVVPVADSADTAWVMVSTLLVLLMAIPGMALFYGGQVRSRNFVSTVMQAGTVTAIASTVWVIIGYSLAFSTTGQDFIGSVQNFMFNNMADLMREDQTVGELVFALFKLGSAVLAPVLIIGALAERVRFGWVAAFALLWLLLVFAPVSRWVSGGGFLDDGGTLDLAGGLAIFTSAGISALVAALMLGKRAETSEPHSPALALAGAGLVWIGGLALTGGSVASAGGDDAARAMINTHLAISVAALVWMLVDRIRNGKAHALGLAQGALAGLAAISAGADVVGPGGAVIIGAVAALLGIGATGLVRKTLGIDDAANVFAIFGVSGIVGTLLLAVFAGAGLGGVGYAKDAGMASQLWLQLKAVGVVGVWSAVVTLIIGYMISMVLPMRVPAEQEEAGLDASSHGVK